MRIYLRQMGVVPLLTREGEQEIAKRIERGQLPSPLKALSRYSPFVIRQTLVIGEPLKRGIRSIKEPWRQEIKGGANAGEEHSIE